MYDVIVLGATFAAAGIAQKLGERCLVIERKGQAGNEFFGALRSIGEEAQLHSRFEKCKLLFYADVVTVEKIANGFSCVTHVVDGFRTFQAKQVVDTRCTEEMCQSKTFNLLIESREAPSFSHIQWERAKGENRYLLCCPVAIACSYPQAREMTLDLVKQFSETQRLILSADVFDYRVKGQYPRTEAGITYLPSKAYASPELAYAAGLSWGEEAVK